MPPAFVLSQDQTLRKTNKSFYRKIRSKHLFDFPPIRSRGSAGLKLNFSRFTSHYSVFNQPTRDKKETALTVPAFEPGAPRFISDGFLIYPRFLLLQAAKRRFFHFFFGSERGTPPAITDKSTRAQPSTEVKRRKTSFNIASIRKMSRRSRRIFEVFCGFLPDLDTGAAGKALTRVAAPAPANTGERRRNDRA